MADVSRRRWKEERLQPFGPMEDAIHGIRVEAEIEIDRPKAVISQERVDREGERVEDDCQDHSGTPRVAGRLRRRLW